MESEVEFHFAVADTVKLVPLMVSVKAPLPEMTEEGLRAEMAGGGWLMVKAATGEIPPVVVTVTLAVPTEATRLAGTAAVTCVGLM